MNLLIVAHTMRTIISHESKTSTMQFVNTIKLINIWSAKLDAMKLIL
jgi:hypothetical protein